LPKCYFCLFLGNCDTLNDVSMGWLRSVGSMKL